MSIFHRLQLTGFILIILLLIIAPSICQIDDNARRDTMCLKMYDIEKRIELYKKDHKKYPLTQFGLLKLLKDNLDGKPYLRKIPKDIWGNSFKYTNTNNIIELISYGMDKKENTEDDIYLSKCREII